MTDKTQAQALAQECADYANSLRSTVMVMKLEHGAAPTSMVRAADLFERAAASIAELQAQAAAKCLHQGAQAARDPALEKPGAGRYVLAWMEGKAIPIRAMWVPSKWLQADDECPEDWAEYDEAKDQFFCPEGWYEKNEHEEKNWSVSTPVVAWMELPRRSAILQAAPPAPAAVAADNRWCPDVCPITGRRFFMWVEHHDTGEDVPTYGGPFDSYTIPVKDEDGTYSCERYDHDFGGWREWESVDLMLVDDQSFVVAPENPRYDQIRDFAQRSALAAAPAQPAAWMTPEGDRVVTAATMASARKDGGAMLSSLRPFTVALARAAAPAQAVPSGMWTIWEALPGYLIDHCEGDIISEEGLQRALEAMLKDPKYSMPVAPAQEHATQLAGQALPADEFRGDTASLVRNIIALLDLDAEGCLVPHGVGGHARGLLSAAASRLAAAPAQAQEDALDAAELREIQRAVEQFADCGETDVDYALLMRAAQAGYLECTHFQVMNESALNLDAIAAQAKGDSDAN